MMKFTIHTDKWLYLVDDMLKIFLNAPIIWNQLFNLLNQLQLILDL